MLIRKEKKKNLALNAPHRITSITWTHFQAKTLQSTCQYTTQQNNQWHHFTRRRLFIFLAQELMEVMGKMEECHTREREKIFRNHIFNSQCSRCEEGRGLAARSAEISPSEGQKQTGASCILMFHARSLREISSWMKWVGVWVYHAKQACLVWWETCQRWESNQYSTWKKAPLWSTQYIFLWGMCLVVLVLIFFFLLVSILIIPVRRRGEGLRASLMSRRYWYRTHNSA